MMGRVPFLDPANKINDLYKNFEKQAMAILNQSYQECLDLLHNSGTGERLYDDKSPQPVIARSKDVTITHIDPNSSKALIEEIQKTALAFEKDLNGGVGKAINQYVQKFDGLFKNFTNSFDPHEGGNLLYRAGASKGPAPKPPAPDQLHA
jgi:hypothetical protein